MTQTSSAPQESLATDKPGSDGIASKLNMVIPISYQGQAVRFMKLARPGAGIRLSATMLLIHAIAFERGERHTDGSSRTRRDQFATILDQLDCELLRINGWDQCPSFRSKVMRALTTAGLVRRQDNSFAFTMTAFWAKLPMAIYAMPALSPEQRVTWAIMANQTRKGGGKLPCDWRIAQELGREKGKTGMRPKRQVQQTLSDFRKLKLVHGGRSAGSPRFLTSLVDVVGQDPVLLCADRESIKMAWDRVFNARRLKGLIEDKKKILEDYRERLNPIRRILNEATSGRLDKQLVQSKTMECVKLQDEVVGLLKAVYEKARSKFELHALGLDTNFQNSFFSHTQYLSGSHLESLPVGVKPEREVLNQLIHDAQKDAELWFGGPIVF